MQRAAVGASGDGPREPRHGVHHPPCPHEVILESFVAFESAVSHYDVAAQEPLCHQREPTVGLRVGVGRGEDHTVVVCRLDADVEGHLARDGETRVEQDLRRVDLRERIFQPQQVFVEIVVLAHVDDDHFVGGIVLREQQRQPFLDERIFFGEHRHDDRNGRFLADGAAPAVLVAGDAAERIGIIIELHDEQNQQDTRKGRAFPTVAREKRIE